MCGGIGGFLGVWVSFRKSVCGRGRIVNCSMMTSIKLFIFWIIDCFSSRLINQNPYHSLGQFGWRMTNHPW